MNKISIRALLLVTAAFNIFFSSALDRKIKKETYVFSVKGTDTLKLDKYDLSLEVNESPKPCVLFVFGGGFSSGSRDAIHNVAFMEEMVHRGYIGIAIDYRLGMKNAADQDLSNPLAFANLFTHTITIAIEDLFDATSYIYSMADEWHINRNQIIASGSSAGALAVLQGEYAICNQWEAVQRLPDGFNYGGIISFAGAIFNPSTDLNWLMPPAPVQMFHGDADKNVPFHKLLLGNMGIFGSGYIAKQFHLLNHPYYFYDVENADHEIAGSPMKENLDDIDSFITRYVLKKEPLMIHSKVKQIGTKDVKKDFTIMDYIQSNYQ